MATVKIYSTPTCPWCKRAKDFLNTNKIAFTDFDVASDEAARADMIKRTGQMGVPVIDVDGDIIIGYDLPKLKAKFSIQ